MMDSQNLLPEMNRRNREFWKNEGARVRILMEDAAVREYVDRQIYSAALRGVPMRLQKSVEALVEEAAEFQSGFLRAQARRGGQAEKSDALQQLIEQIAREDPKISGKALLRRLERDADGGVIEEVGRDSHAISFRQANGTLGKAPISGLKDRLSRAKRKARSRQPVRAPAEHSADQNP
jgi:hypothetical protein